MPVKRLRDCGMNEWKEEVVTTIESCRLSQGMSQEKAANRAGISQPYWSLVASGTKLPSYEAIRSMALAVGLRWREARVVVPGR